MIHSFGRFENRPAEHYVLKNVRTETLVINEYELPHSSDRRRLEEMVSHGLRSYIDATYYTKDGRYVSTTHPLDFAQIAARIVGDAIWIQDLELEKSFSGFSTEIAHFVSALNRVHDFQVNTDETLEYRSDEKNFQLYTFQRMVYDLKMATELEVAIFFDSTFPPSGNLNTKPTPVILSPGDYQLDVTRNTQSALGDLKPDFDVLKSEEIPQKKKSRKRRRDKDAEFSERIITLLEQNNRILANYDKRFESIQDQIDNITNKPSNSGTSRESEIAELREMIIKLANGEPLTEGQITKNDIATKKGLTLNFDKNAYSLTVAQKLILNQVNMQMLANSGWAALITGYADKSGEPNFNAWISQKRAEAVTMYLQSLGISEQRLIINFFGDDQSESSNAEDRKVEITYLVNYADRK